ncbi:MAG: hypothetical protein M9930_19045 [Anaerolineae bacterium]|nr:hypothetical protein [Anaerolineae bacterium]
MRVARYSHGQWQAVDVSPRHRSLRQWLLILSPLLLPLLYRRGLRARPFFRWYDLWVGVYVDTASGSVYVCPIPMLGIKVWKC